MAPRMGGSAFGVPETMNDLFPTIHEDEELLAINKPAGLVCHPTKGDAYSSLISRVRLYLGERSRPQLINRLDRETSGVTLIGKSPEASREIRKLWERGHVHKTYLAIVCGHLRDASGIIDAPLGRDETSCVAIKDKVRPDGAAARTCFQRLASYSSPDGDFSLLELQPLTGRKHQIRIHLAHCGHPVVGDKLYGGDERLYLDFVLGRLSDDQRRTLRLPNHALHASCVSFVLWAREVAFCAEPESWFVEFLAALTRAR